MKNNRGKAFYFLIFIFLLVFNSCKEDENVSGGNQQPGANEVWMQNDAFTPATKTVAMGTTILWTNKESDLHTVTSGTPGSPSGVFGSTDLSLNGTFSFTFNTQGTFQYFCQNHNGMTGTIIVQ
jgi:plastocyanin